MSEHTKGRLASDPLKVGLVGDISTLDGTTIATAQQVPGDDARQTRRRANTARLVACWNACADINPEAVPDLLAACEAALSHILNREGPWETVGEMMSDEGQCVICNSDSGHVENCPAHFLPAAIAKARTTEGGRDE